MTEEDKALVAQLRDDESYYHIAEKHWCIDGQELDRQRLTAADRIEAQAAENEKLRDGLMKASREMQGYKDALAQVEQST